MKIAINNENGTSSIFVQGEPDFEIISRYVPAGKNFKLIPVKQNIYFIKIKTEQEVNYNNRIKFISIE